MFGYTVFSVLKNRLQYVVLRLFGLEDLVLRKLKYRLQ